MFDHGRPPDRVHSCVGASRGIQSSGIRVGDFLVCVGRSTKTLVGRQRLLIEATSERSVKVDLTATEAEWQNGAAEHRIGQIKDMCDKLFDELSVRGEDAVGPGVSIAANAIKELAFRGAVSPNQ